MANYYSSYTVLLIIFKIVVTSKLSTGTRNHAYFSPNEDSQYIGDTLPVSFHKEFPGTSGKISIDESLFSSRIHLKFLPPVLDFKERPLGIPHHERVTIINLSCNRTVLMSSISGSTVHFHSSFFQDKLIPPLGNTTFSVVFLGRGEGEIKSYLYIHTSEGSFKYQVRSASVSSPYRLRSLSGVKLPLNSTYTPAIFIHNPHSTTLQILEVYSSGHEFHLELPSGELGGPKHIWQIPPFCTKPIIRLRFYATSQKNHSAYVRIKLDKGNQILMMPLDVEVSSAGGLFSTDDLINFGVGGTKDSPKQIKLFLRNSARKPLRVMSIVTSPFSKAIKVDLKSVTVPSRSKIPTEVALLTFDWNAAFKTGVSSGKLIVKSNQHSKKLILQYYASVFVGSLEYDPSLFRFKSDESVISPRKITLKNNFNFPVIITNVTFCQSATPFFKIKDFSPTAILPGEEKSIFSIEVRNNFYLERVKLDSAVHILSNATTLSIPLSCYDGKLKQVLPWETNDTFLNIGSVIIGNTKKFYFGLINDNPIDVFINKMDVNISNAVIGVVAVDHGNITNAMKAISSEYKINRSGQLHLNSRSYCVIEVSIPAQERGYIYGIIFITTDFENLKIGIKLKVDEGKEIELYTTPLKHDSCTPCICRTELAMDSQVSLTDHGSNASHPQKPSLGLLTSYFVLPFSNMIPPHFTWETNQTVTCYPLATNSSGGLKWLNSAQVLFLPSQWDIDLLIMRYENYLRISNELMKLTSWMNSSFLKNYTFKGLIKQDWPVLATLEPKMLEYPRPRRGNITYNDLIITHSSPRPPLAQLILEPSYPPSDYAYDFPISNNITVSDMGKPTNHGRYGSFRYSSRKSGSSMPLFFEISEKHLRGCDRNGEGKGSRLTLTARRSFLARNTGIVQLKIIGFLINGYPCEGFGFRILNCQSFLLPQKSSRKIEITFTPDFTLSKVTRILTVLTPDSSVNYTLIATLPPYLLSVCSNAIKRPAWEPLVYYSAISVMLFLLICVLGAAFFESNRILRNTIISLSRDNNIQPVLDLRAIGSEAVSSSEQKVMHCEVQGKIAWTPITSFTEEQSNKENQKPLPESVLTAVNNIKVQTIINGINQKKKSERIVSKRLPDIPEHSNEKSNSETSSNRSNSSQASSKPTKTSICITTEPYIPLANIKTRDSSLQKADFSNSKFEQPKFIECQRRRTRKRNQNNQNSNNISDSSNKKKTSEQTSVKNNVDGSISSRTTSESSCSDDGEKEHVESVFFQSVRHHLQSKVSKGRQIKVPSSSPHLKRKKSLDKVINVAASVDWDGDEEDSVEKATIVRNNRRSNANGKQLKKQAVNSYAKMRFEQSQPRGKPLNVERSMKNSLRKDKTQTTKKRNDRQEKRITTTTRAPAAIMISHEGIAPAIPSPPVWTASFSDVVAGTDSAYLHANKNNVSQNQKQQPSPCTNGVESTSPCSSAPTNSAPTYSPLWKNEYQDALEQQDSSSGQASVEVNHPLNNIWGNWSSLAESLQSQSSVLQASANNSLFTDGSTQATTYDTIWHDQNLLKVIQDQQEVENSQSYHSVRNEITWPVITSLWEPLYTPSTAVESPPPVWGSEVWGPPVSPPPPNPPPPVEEMVHNMEYDPFRSLSNIWGQHSPNIWKPPPSE